MKSKSSKSWEKTLFFYLFEMNTNSLIAIKLILLVIASSILIWVGMFFFVLKSDDICKIQFPFIVIEKTQCK